MNKNITFSVNDKTQNIIVKCEERSVEIINNMINADQIYSLLDYQIGDVFDVSEINFDEKYNFLVKPAETFKGLIDKICVEIQKINISDENNSELPEKLESSDKSDD